MKIFLIGFMGCGKTHWGRQLADKLHLPFLDLDEEIERETGKSVTDIFSEKGEEGFRQIERASLHQLTESGGSFVMSTGGGTPCFFNNIDYLLRKGVVVWLNTSVETICQRLRKERSSRPLVAAIPDSELRAFVLKKYSGRKIFYQQAHVILPEEDLTLENLVTQIFHANS